jgi:predicted PurR-regulated permease PerM
VGWRTRDLVRAGAIIMGMYVGGLLFWEARALALLSFLGILFGLAVAAGVDVLQRFRIPRGIAAAVIVLGTLGVLAGTFAWSAPTLRAQSVELREKFPQAIDRVERWIDSHRGGMIGAVLSAGGSADSTLGDKGRAPRDTVVVAVDTVSASGSSLRKALMSRMGGVQKLLFPFVTSTVTAVGAVLYLIFLAIYVGAEPDVYHSGLMHLFPHRSRKRAAEVMTAIAVALRRWLVTQLIAMLAIGVVTTIALLILRVPAALPLGIIAGFFEFIPTLGPVLSAVPAVVMGFVDSPEKAGLVALVYIGIQFLENHILIPLLMREGVDLPPALTIMSQALMAMLFGFLGLLVAVPALAATMVAVKMLYVEDVVGDDITVLDAGVAAEGGAGAEG